MAWSILMVVGRCPALPMTSLSRNHCPDDSTGLRSRLPPSPKARSYAVAERAGVLGDDVLARDP